MQFKGILKILKKEQRKGQDLPSHWPVMARELVVLSQPTPTTTRSGAGTWSSQDAATLPLPRGKRCWAGDWSPAQKFQRG